MSANRNLFDEYADDYDGHRPELIPQFESFYGTMLDRIPHDRDEPLDVLDLGAGTGLSTDLVRSRYPRADFVLLDASEEMLDRARDRFADENYEYRQADAANMKLSSDRYDAVVSALVLHYLSPADKRTVFRRVYPALKDGGAFVVGTLVDGGSDAVRKQHRNQWIREAREAGAPEEAIREARERQKNHELASLQQHLEWLRQVGFDCVDCWFKYYGLAVFSGRK